MKTKSLFRMALKASCYLLVFLGTLLNANAQCPTVTNSNPTPICDGAGLTFTELTTYLINDGSLNENGAFVRYYDNPTGGMPNASANIVTEGTYFVDNNNPSVDCSPRQQINIDFVVDDSGVTFINSSYCSDDTPNFQEIIDDNIAGSIPAGGSVELFSSENATGSISPTTDLNIGLNLVFIVFTDSAGCRSQVEPGLFTVTESLEDPTPQNPQEFCTNVNPNPTIGDLDPGTTDPFQWFDAVDSNGNPIDPNNPLDPSTPLIDGNTYYVWASGPCPSNAVPVLVNIDDPFNPGTSTTLNYCEDNIPTNDINLYDELGAPKDPVGTWSGPLATSNGHLGTVNISSLGVGVYIFTYTVPANGICPEDTATVTINIEEKLFAGTALSPAEFCEGEDAANNSPYDLFQLLMAGTFDAGGTWSDDDASGALTGNEVDLTLLTAANSPYNFTYTVSNVACLDDTETVQITIKPLPNVGTVNNPPPFCENDSALNPINLFDYLTGEEQSGTWYDGSDNSGAVVTNPTMVDLSSNAIGTYNYFYEINGANGCDNDATITIDIVDAPESGTPVATFPEFCEGEAPVVFDLFDLLDGEDQTGTWYSGTDNTGATVANPIDASVLTPGTYNYTFDVDAIGSCVDDLVNVQITINALPNVGTVNNPPPFCENDPALNPINLFDYLTGEDQTGTWYEGTDATGTVVTNPTMIDLSSNAIGTYNYFYEINGANGCDNDAIITINIVDAPNAGTLNSEVTDFCISEIVTGQTINLNDYLDGEDPGVWSENPPASGQLAGNILTIDGLAAGSYTFTYDVNAIGSCDDPNMPSVTITINDTAEPTASATQDFCDAATVGDLAATGNNIQWYDDATGGTALDPATTLVDGETYYATQTNAATGCESSTRFEVTVTIVPLPNSGNVTTPTLIICNNTTVDLNDYLDGEDPGGTWMEVNTTGAVTGSTFDANGIAPGDYQFTYVVTAAPCADATTTITVTVEEPLSSGTSNGDLMFCSSDAAFDLFSNISGEDVGGDWIFNGAEVSNIFDPETGQSGTYTYFIDNECGNSSTSFDISVSQAPNAGTDGSFTICAANVDSTNNILDLLTVLQDMPDSTGTFSNDNGANGFSGTTLDLSVVTPGTYNFTYTVTATAPCTMDATAIATVTINDTAAVTVINAMPSFCASENPTVADLDASVNGTNIIWYAEENDTTPLTSTDALEDGEDYFAVNDGSNGCESSVKVQVNVSVGDAPTPTLLDANLELCINDNPTIAELTANITEFNASTNNVVWYTTSTGGTPITSTTVLELNTTYYAVLIDPDSGCESSVRLEVNPDLTGCGLLVIPDGFSPNGDGVNDTFDMDNLEILYPNFEIEIYNRYGNVVYKGNASSPRFDGTSNQSRLISNGDLPVGVYYYIFNFNDGVNKPTQGNLYLSR